MQNLSKDGGHLILWITSADAHRSAIERLQQDKNDLSPLEESRIPPTLAAKAHFPAHQLRASSPLGTPLC